jgi:hypothetical protein
MPSMSEPQLLRASALLDRDPGQLVWRRDHNDDLLSVSTNGVTVMWDKAGDAKHQAAWVPIESCARLFGGSFEWDFLVEEMAGGQIGIGFMLLWDIGPDWGFFGYLGSSTSAWSYDLSSGDVVYATESIEGGLPASADGHTGTVTVKLELPVNAAGTAWFRVNGVTSKPIALPEGAVVMPAACLLRPTQRVTLIRASR